MIKGELLECILLILIVLLVCYKLRRTNKREGFSSLRRKNRRTYCPLGKLTWKKCGCGFGEKYVTKKGLWGMSLKKCEKCPKGTFSSSGYYHKTRYCKKCPPGSFGSKEGSNMCTKCPKGYYSNTEGAIGSTSCKKCPKGEYSEEGSAACEKCPPGTFSEEGASECTKCPAGKFRFYSSDISECRNCQAGTYSKEGASECKKCLAGTFSEKGASECTNCPAGETSEEGASKCTKCPAGKSSKKGGMCEPCSAGTFSEKGASECTKCQAGTYSKEGASECEKCPAGETSKEGASECIKCPTGTSSKKGGVCKTPSLKWADMTELAGPLVYNCLTDENVGDCVRSNYGCNIGTYLDRDEAKCKPCSEGTYTNRKMTEELGKDNNKLFIEVKGHQWKDFPGGWKHQKEACESQPTCSYNDETPAFIKLKSKEWSEVSNDDLYYPSGHGKICNTDEFKQKRKCVLEDEVVKSKLECKEIKKKGFSLPYKLIKPDSTEEIALSDTCKQAKKDGDWCIQDKNPKPITHFI